MRTSDAAPTIELRPAEGAADLDLAATLLREYAASLEIDLCFQNFAAELAELPGNYAAPAGRLLLAFVDAEAAGCGALRALTDPELGRACEMKRLYVRPAFRRYGLGRRLAEALIDEARRAGYATMLLDTFESMASARRLYASLGFEEVAPYYPNPLPGVHYLKATLT